MIISEQKRLPEGLRAIFRKLEASPLATRFARGVFWSLFGSVTSRVLAVISSIIAARLIGKSAFGELGIVQNTIAMVGTLAGFGLGTTALKYVAEFRGQDSRRTGRMIALFRVAAWGTGTILGVLLVGIAPWLCRSILKQPDLTGYVQIGSLLMLFSAVNGSQNGVLSGFEAFKTIARVTTIGGLLNFPMIVGGALYAGLPGIVCALILGQMVACLLNAHALRLEMIRHNIPLTFIGWTRELPVLWQFSVPAVLGTLVISPVTWACTAMLVRQPHGLEHMGAFNAANQWFNALMWLPYMMDQAVLPILSERFGAKDRTQTSILLFGLIKLNAAIAIPLVLIGGLLSPYIMGGYGTGFVGEWPTLVAMLATAGLFAIQLPVGNVIAASGRMWLGLCLNLTWSVVFISASWFLVGWGSLGLAIARFLAYVAQAIWSFAYAITAVKELGAAPVTGIEAVPVQTGSQP